MRLRGVAALALVAVSSTGCGVNGLNFRQDERVEITSPRDRESVALPITVSWDVKNFEVTGRDGAARPDAGYFGVYIDRAPQPPDRTQEWIARDDERCEIDPACPNEIYLAERDVYSTTEQRFVIERLAIPEEDAVRRREFHEVTIVLLNGRGERIGESAFVREFEVDRG